MHEPSYLDLPVCFSPAGLRLATQAERDYLTTRVDDLSTMEIAITLFDHEGRFYFAVAEDLTFAMLR